MKYTEKTVKVDKESMYQMYKDMCSLHEFPVLNIENIDEVFVHFKDRVITHFCFVWNTNSKMALMGFPISNLAIPSEFREGCLDNMIDGICCQLKEDGYNIAWTTSSTERVISSLEKNGFARGDEAVHTYIKSLP